MCRLVGWVSDTPRTLRSVLGDEAAERLLQLSTVHCHGWGVAWHDDGGVLRTARSPRAAHDDPDFAALLDGAPMRDATVHLRMGTPGYRRTVTENHPFSDGEWSLIHNGAVAPTAQVDALLPAGAVPSGSTDSERWFLALRSRLAAGMALPDAVRAVIAHAAAAGLHASSWNSLLLGRDALHAVNHHDRAWIPVDVKVWPELYPDEAVTWPPYFDLSMREGDGLVTVVSSGIVDDPDGWTLVPNESVVTVSRDGAVSLVELGPVGELDPVGARDPVGALGVVGDLGPMGDLGPAGRATFQ